MSEIEKIKEIITKSVREWSFGNDYYDERKERITINEAVIAIQSLLTQAQIELLEEMRQEIEKPGYSEDDRVVIRQFLDAKLKSLNK